MKNLNILLVILLVLITACSSTSVEDNYKIVSFDTSLTCDHCKSVMFDNIPKENGVIDLKVNVEKKVVKILFNEKETTVETLADVIYGLGYSAYVIKVDKYSGEFE